MRPVIAAANAAVIQAAVITIGIDTYDLDPTAPAAVRHAGWVDRRSAISGIRQAALESGGKEREHGVARFDQPFAMKLLGLDLPLPSNSAAVRDVLAAAAATLGFGLGSWLLEAPLDRPGAVALFIGLLYIMLADPFLALKDARIKRYALASTGAGILIAAAAVLERFAYQ